MSLVTYDLLVVGDSGVGKTSIVSRYINDTFRTEYNPSNTVELSSKFLEINGSKIWVRIWTEANKEVESKANKEVGSKEPREPDEGYAMLNKEASWFQSPDVAIIVSDTTRHNYLTSIEKWVRILSKHAVKKYPIYIFANKLDLLVRILAQSAEQGFPVPGSVFDHKSIDNLGENLDCDCDYILSRISGCFASSAANGHDVEKITEVIKEVHEENIANKKNETL